LLSVGSQNSSSSQSKESWHAAPGATHACARQTCPVAQHAAVHRTPEAHAGLHAPSTHSCPKAQHVALAPQRTFDAHSAGPVDESPPKIGPGPPPPASSSSGASAPSVNSLEKLLPHAVTRKTPSAQHADHDQRERFSTFSS
jgi:hypothetical protein